MRTDIFYSSIVLCVLILLFFGSTLLSGDTMFLAHDETQVARVEQFAYALRTGQIPPRMAPQFSYDLGYPVFTYYAPFAYWISAGFTFFGLDSADAVKASYMMALCVGFFGMIAFMRRFVGQGGARIAAVLLLTSPWIASEIFVRGNLAEVWILGLFPAALFLLEENSKKYRPVIFALTSIVVGALVSAHNVGSLIALPFLWIYILVLSKKRRNFIAIGLGVLVSAYYLFPALFELSYVQARSIAAQTSVLDHILCPWQIWTTRIWGFGGSAPGCDQDGMSFMIGKLHVLLGSAGFVLYAASWLYIRLKKYVKGVHGISRSKATIVSPQVMLLGLFTIFSVFMTISVSSFLWKTVAFLEVFQFPWRFLIFVVFGTAVFAGIAYERVRIMPLRIGIILLVLISLIRSLGYFQSNALPKTVFLSKYVSDRYIRQEAARKIPEYVPVWIDYSTWQSYVPDNAGPVTVPGNTISPENIIDEPYIKAATVRGDAARIQILYFPYWHITVDGQTVYPEIFDPSGRPIIPLDGEKHRIVVTYRQTPLETLATTVSVLTIILLILLLIERTHALSYRLLR